MNILKKGKRFIVRDGREYKEFYSWMPDNKDTSTEAVAYVSSDGDFITGSYFSWNVRNKCKQKRKEKTLKKSKRGDYLRVCVNNKSISCHRALAIAWVDGYFDGAQVNHKNGIKTDNTVCNIEWVTASENQLHIASVLKKRCGEKHSNSKITNKEAKKIKEMLLDGVKGVDIAREIGVSKSLVSAIKTKKTWNHI